ncbi:hypothetical protein Plhal304r1_c070g0158921 [Plasmopara halstedii]
MKIAAGRTNKFKIEFTYVNDNGCHVPRSVECSPVTASFLSDVQSIPIVKTEQIEVGAYVSHALQKP